MCVRILKENVPLEPNGSGRMFKVIYPGPHNFLPGPFSDGRLSYNNWHKATFEPIHKTPHKTSYRPEKAKPLIEIRDLWKEGDNWFSNAKVVGFTGFPLRSAAERYTSGNGTVSGLIVEVHIRGPLSIGFIEERWGYRRQDIVWLAQTLLVDADSVIKAQSS